MKRCMVIAQGKKMKDMLAPALLKGAEDAQEKSHQLTILMKKIMSGSVKSVSCHEVADWKSEMNKYNDAAQKFAKTLDIMSDE